MSLRLRRSLACPFVFVALLAIAAVPSGASEAEAKENKDNPHANGQPAAHEPSPLIPTNRQEEMKTKDLVMGARAYFDLDEEHYTGRKAFVSALEEWATEGKYPLADMCFLRWMVAQSRSFLPRMEDRKWARARGLELTKRGLQGWEAKGPGLWMHWRTPNEYPKKNKSFEDFPRDGPYPLLFVMHRKNDADERDGAGGHLLKTRWAKSDFPEIHEDWLVLVPIAAAAIYSQEGRIRREHVLDPLQEFWQHYHMDFDRVILDGDEDALLLLGSSPVFFAGAILREGTLGDDLKPSVKNYAHIPLYVVDNAPLAKALEEAGHPNVTVGAQKDVMAWMKPLKRVTPRSFTWHIGVPEQVLAHWVNIDQPDWENQKRELKVEVVDTEEKPNTIEIEANGVAELSLYLNDEVVDIGRPVRVVINGHLEHDEMLPLPELVQTLKRDPDTIFNKTPKVRQSRYYGWLKSGLIIRIPVKPPAKKDEAVEETAPEEDAPKATPRDEARAKRLYENAQSLKEANPDKAKGYLRRIIDEFPVTAHTDKAKELLAELGG